MKTTLQVCARHLGLLGLLAVSLASLGWAGGGLPQEQPQAPSPAATQTESYGNKAPLTLEERADIYMARKSYGDAIDYYNRSLKQSNFQNPVVWNKLGIAFQQQMNYRASIKSYNQAIRLKKDYPEAWNNLGTTYYMQNKAKKSIKYYLHALKISPDSASFHMNLGTSYYKMKKYKQSVDEYRTALGLDPNIFAERSSVGTIVQAKGADPEYYYYVAKVFAAAGRAEDAIRYLRRAFEDGFKDDKRIQGDPDFQKISQNPEFVELMKNRPVSIKD